MIKIQNIKCRHLKTSIVEKYLETQDVGYQDDDKHIVLSVQDTIQSYTLRLQDYTIYDEFVQNQHEHNITNFKTLQDIFDAEKLELYRIKVLYSNKFNAYIVQDGVHRLALYCINYDTIPIKYLEIKYEKTIVENIKYKLGATKNISHYNHWGVSDKLQSGYHSYNIANIQLSGQRNPSERLDIFKKYIDFTNKTVVDMGCSTGGMLLHLPELKKGIGFDYDVKSIEAARYISNVLSYDVNYCFEVQDLNNITTIPNADIVFLLSLGSWIKNWKALYTLCLDVKIIILETNNDEEGKPQLDFFRNRKIKLISDASKDDITLNHKRKTYLIT